MVKLLKCCLSILAIGLLTNCDKTDKYEAYTLAERKKMSLEYLENGEKNYNQGSPENMKLIEIAIELDPENSSAWRELSVPYLKRGLPHEWKPLFDKAVEVDPIMWQGWRGYLKLFFYRDYESAIEDFNATDSLTPNFTDYPQSMSVDYLRGLSYLQLSENDKALKYFTKYIDEVIKKDGEKWVDVNAFIYRAIVNIKMKNYSDARMDLETCLKYYPYSSDAFYHLSIINLSLGDKVKAKEQIIKAKELFEKGYFMQVSYVETFEQIYLSDIENVEKQIDG